MCLGVLRRSAVFLLFLFSFQSIAWSYNFYGTQVTMAHACNQILMGSELAKMSEVEAIVQPKRDDDDLKFKLKFKMNGKHYEIEIHDLNPEYVNGDSSYSASQAIIRASSAGGYFLSVDGEKRHRSFNESTMDNRRLPNWVRRERLPMNLDYLTVKIYIGISRAALNDIANNGGYNSLVTNGTYTPEGTTPSYIVIEDQSGGGEFSVTVNGKAEVHR